VGLYSVGRLLVLSIEIVGLSLYRGLAFLRSLVGLWAGVQDASKLSSFGRSNS
jgi:hypothetical protein